MSGLNNNESPCPFGEGDSFKCLGLIRFFWGIFFIFLANTRLSYTSGKVEGTNVMIKTVRLGLLVQR